MLGAVVGLAVTALTVAVWEVPRLCNSRRAERVWRQHRALAEATGFQNRRTWYQSWFPTIAEATSKLKRGRGLRLVGGASPERTVFERLPFPVARPETALLNMIQELQELLAIGMNPHKVWNSLGIMTNHEGVPYQQAIEGQLKNRAGVKELDLATTRNAHVLVVIALVSHNTGIGLGALLNSVQESLASAIMLDRHRTTAVSGPKASARILQVLPLLGVVAAFLIGVNPLAWFLSSWLGALCASCGLLLLLAGRRWTTHLVEKATGTVSR